MLKNKWLFSLLWVTNIILFPGAIAAQSTLEIQYTRETLPYDDSFGKHSMKETAYNVRMLLNDSFALAYYFSNSVNRRENGKRVGHKLVHHHTFYDFLNNETLFEINFSKREKYLVKDSNRVCNWKFYDEEKTILNKKCKMALSVDHKNDSTLLWFTNELPFRKGPLFYPCIPGVVMEVFDQTRNIHFLAATIRKRQIQLVYPEEGVKLSFTEWAKIRDARKSSRR